MKLIITCQFSSGFAAHRATRALYAFGLTGDLTFSARDYDTDDRVMLGSAKKATALKRERDLSAARGIFLSGFVALTTLIGGGAALGCVFLFGMPWGVAIFGAAFGAAIGWSARAAVLPTGSRITVPMRRGRSGDDAHEAKRHIALSVRAERRDQADLVDILEAYGATDMTISQ
jgi:hypothetical protein